MKQRLSETGSGPAWMRRKTAQSTLYDKAIKSGLREEEVRAACLIPSNVETFQSSPFALLPVFVEAAKQGEAVVNVYCEHHHRTLGGGRMNGLRSFGAAGLLPLFCILASTAADAATSLPIGTQVGAATDTLTLTGTYTSGTGAQPFASPNFTFTAVLPQEVSFQSSIGSENFLIPTLGASYTDNGQTQTFSASPANGPAGNSNGAALRSGSTDIEFTAINNQGEFVLDAPATTGSYYTLAADGLTATINPSAYTVLSGDATYEQFDDPPFTGTITVTPNAGGGGGGGPEPSTWALMMVGVFGVGLTLRRGKAENGLALAA